jgi:hypothetical protein
MADRYETFVRWYLRFNGYLTVENFVIHEPVAGGVPQGGEFDVVGVRFPYSRESPGFDIELDKSPIDDQAREDRLVDVVIAEVKSGGRTGLNPIWSGRANSQARMEYL